MLAFRAWFAFLSRWLNGLRSYWTGTGVEKLARFMSSGDFIHGLDRLSEDWLQAVGETSVPDMARALDAMAFSAPSRLGNPEKPKPASVGVIAGQFKAAYDLRSEVPIQLVTELAHEQRELLREQLEEAMKGNQTAPETARNLRQFIGLHSRQVAALERARARLVAQGFTGDELAKKMARLSEKALRYRTLMIARTSLNQALQEDFLARTFAGPIEPELLQKVWIVTPDDRLCPLCASMEGVVAIPATESFDFHGKKVVSPAFSHPNCRCSFAIVPVNPADVAKLPPAQRAKVRRRKKPEQTQPVAKPEPPRPAKPEQVAPEIPGGDRIVDMMWNRAYWAAPEIAHLEGLASPEQPEFYTRTQETKRWNEFLDRINWSLREKVEEHTNKLAARLRKKLGLTISDLEKEALRWGQAYRGVTSTVAEALGFPATALHELTENGERFHRALVEELERLTKDKRGAFTIARHALFPEEAVRLTTLERLASRVLPRGARMEIPLSSDDLLGYSGTYYPKEHRIVLDKKLETPFYKRLVLWHEAGHAIDYSRFFYNPAKGQYDWDFGMSLKMDARQLDLLVLKLLSKGNYQKDANGRPIFSTAYRDYLGTTSAYGTELPSILMEFLAIGHPALLFERQLLAYLLILLEAV